MKCADASQSLPPEQLAAPQSQNCNSIEGLRTLVLLKKEVYALSLDLLFENVDLIEQQNDWFAFDLIRDDHVLEQFERVRHTEGVFILTQSVVR